jgi:hypothetical protein
LPNKSESSRKSGELIPTKTILQETKIYDLLPKNIVDGRYINNDEIYIRNKEKSNQKEKIRIKLKDYLRSSGNKVVTITD